MIVVENKAVQPDAQYGVQFGRAVIRGNKKLAKSRKGARV